MTLTLTRLLEIKTGLINYEDERGLMLAEQFWQEHGMPSEAQPLCDVLERILRRCKEEVVLYPPVLLLRKKGLERGTWSPPAKRPPDADNPLPKEGDPNCQKCGGTGHVVAADGRSAKFCECNK